MISWITGLECIRALLVVCPANTRLLIQTQDHRNDLKHIARHSRGIAIGPDIDFGKTHPCLN